MRAQQLPSAGWASRASCTAAGLAPVRRRHWPALRNYSSPVPVRCGAAVVAFCEWSICHHRAATAHADLTTTSFQHDVRYQTHPSRLDDPMLTPCSRDHPAKGRRRGCAGRVSAPPV
jgi:hypothetical protein